MLTLLAALLVAQAHVHEAAPEHNPPPVAQNAPRPQGTTIDLKVNGETSPAYLARPKGKPRAALLVLHEWWGLTDWIKDMADQLADQGYLALAVDLYKGKVTTDPKEAAQLMQSKDEQWGDAVEAAGVQWLRQNAQGVKLGTIGWCMGGGQSLRASLNNAGEVNATVMFYGPPVLEVEKLKTLRGPLLGIWGNEDKGITPQKVAAFDKALTQAGVKHEFHAYDAGHGFANPSSGTYSSPAAKDAWQKTGAFLAKTLK